MQMATYPAASIQACSQFKHTHQFIFEVCEAIYRAMIEQFKSHSPHGDSLQKAIVAKLTSIRTSNQD